MTMMMMWDVVFAVDLFLLCDLILMTPWCHRVQVQWNATFCVIISHYPVATCVHFLLSCELLAHQLSSAPRFQRRRVPTSQAIRTDGPLCAFVLLTLVSGNPVTRDHLLDLRQSFSISIFPAAFSTCWQLLSVVEMGRYIKLIAIMSTTSILSVSYRFV